MNFIQEISEFLRWLFCGFCCDKSNQVKNPETPQEEILNRRKIDNDRMGYPFNQKVTQCRNTSTEPPKYQTNMQFNSKNSNSNTSRNIVNQQTIPNTISSYKTGENNQTNSRQYSTNKSDPINVPKSLSKISCQNKSYVNDRDTYSPMKTEDHQMKPSHISSRLTRYNNQTNLGTHSKDTTNQIPRQRQIIPGDLKHEDSSIGNVDYQVNKSPCEKQIMNKPNVTNMSADTRADKQKPTFVASLDKNARVYDSPKTFNLSRSIDQPSSCNKNDRDISLSIYNKDAPLSKYSVEQRLLNRSEQGSVDPMSISKKDLSIMKFGNNQRKKFEDDCSSGNTDSSKYIDTFTGNGQEPKRMNYPLPLTEKRLLPKDQCPPSFSLNKDRKERNFDQNYATDKYKKLINKNDINGQFDECCDNSIEEILSVNHNRKCNVYSKEGRIDAHQNFKNDPVISKSLVYEIGSYYNNDPKEAFTDGNAYALYSNTRYKDKDKQILVGQSKSETKPLLRESDQLNDNTNKFHKSEKVFEKITSVTANNKTFKYQKFNKDIEINSNLNEKKMHSTDDKSSNIFTKNPNNQFPDATKEGHIDPPSIVEDDSLTIMQNRPKLEPYSNEEMEYENRKETNINNDESFINSTYTAQNIDTYTDHRQLQESRSRQIQIEQIILSTNLPQSTKRKSNSFIDDPSNKMPKSQTSELIPVPLKNPRGYCFFNSVMQVLRGCIEFTEQIISYHKSGRIVHSEANDKDKLFVNHFSKLMFEMSQTNQSPDSCSKTLENVHSYFQDSMDGDDVQKCFMQTLTAISNVTKEPYTGSSNAIDKAQKSYKVFRKKNNTFLLDLFYGQMRFTTVCKKCGFAVNEMYNMFKTLPLPVNSNGEDSTLSDCIQCFLAPSEIVMDERLTCECIGGSLDFYTATDFIMGPKYLFIYLTRGSYYVNGVKNEAFVEFQETLDLPTTNGSTKYKLISVIEHIGNNDGGHYYCKLNYEGTQWWLISDTQVTRLDSSIRNIKTKKANVLMFKKL